MPVLGICMTNNISLKDWQNNGQVYREKLYFKKFLKNGYKLSLITFGNNKDLKIVNSKINIIPLYGNIKKYKNKILNFFLNYWRLNFYKRLILEIDLLKTNQLSSSILAILICFLYKKKLLLRVGYEPLMNYKIMLTNNYLRKIENKKNFYQLKLFFLGLISYKFSSHIICTSEKQRDFISRNFFISESKISIIPNWIDTKKFSPLYSQNNRNGVLYVGRLEPEKNPKILVESMIGINKKLTLIGSGSLKYEIINLAKKYNVEIEIINPVPNHELVNYYRECSVYIIPSFYEGNPKTLLEAMACGCAVIGSNVIGIKEIIKKEIGFLFNDVSELRDAMRKIFNDQAKARLMGNRARKYIEKNNNIDKCLKKEISLISKLLKQKIS